MTAPWQPGTALTEEKLNVIPLIGRIVAQFERAASQTITSQATPQAGNALRWDTVSLDLLGGWSETVNPSRYTPPVPGLYLLAGKTSFVTDSDIRVRGGTYAVNGTPADGGRSVIVGPTSGAPGLSYVCPMVTSAVALNGSSDFVELWAVQASAAGGVSSDLDTQTFAGGRPQLTVIYAGPLS